MTPELGRGTRLTNLSSTLWRLREVLDHLLFKIFETELILESDAHHWLAKAGRELDAALQELRHVEVMRAVETVALADQLHLPADITLGELAEQAPPPWPSIFIEHRTALRALTDRVDGAAERAPEPTEVGGSPAQPRFAAVPDHATDVDLGEDLDVELVRRFVADTLRNARQISLLTFLA
jgi:hypothetical protein